MKYFLRTPKESRQLLLVQRRQLRSGMTPRGQVEAVVRLGAQGNIWNTGLELKDLGWV